MRLKCSNLVIMVQSTLCLVVENSASDDWFFCFLSFVLYVVDVVTGLVTNQKQKNNIKKRTDLQRQSAIRSFSPLLVFGACGVAAGDLERNVMPVEEETFLGIQLDCCAGRGNLPTNLSFPPRCKSSWLCDTLC